MKRKDVINDMPLYQAELINLVENYFTQSVEMNKPVKWLFQDSSTWFEQINILYGTDSQNLYRLHKLFSVSGLHIPRDDGSSTIILNLGNLGITTWVTKQQVLDNIVGVMLHELTHCIVKKHNDDFYEILHQLGCNVITEDSFATVTGEVYRKEDWPTIITIEQLHKIKEYR